MTGSDPDLDPDVSADAGADTDTESDHDDPDRLVTTLHGRLATTVVRPVRGDASRWLGEAEAVAGDLVVGSLPDEEVIRTRLSHVKHPLSSVDETEDEAADEHVVPAWAALADALAIFGDGGRGGEWTKTRPGGEERAVRDERWEASGDTGGGEAHVSPGDSVREPAFRGGREDGKVFELEHPEYDERVAAVRGV